MNFHESTAKEYRGRHGWNIKKSGGKKEGTRLKGFSSSVLSRVDFVAEEKKNKEEEEEEKEEDPWERSGSRDEKKGDLGSSNYDAVVRTPST